jgi:predicted glycosyltransferase
LGAFVYHSQQIDVTPEMIDQFKKHGCFKIPRESPIRKETGAFYAVPRGYRIPEQLVEGEYVIIDRTRETKKITTTKVRVKVGKVIVDIAW